jgi:hypothetical protein
MTVSGLALLESASEGRLDHLDRLARDLSHELAQFGELARS